VSADTAAFMADSQVPWGLEALIPPDAQRAMSKRAGSTVVEVKGSHSVYVSQPKAVADLIAKAANSVPLAATK